MKESDPAVRNPFAVRAVRLHRTEIFLNVLFYLFVALSVAGLVGAVVCVCIEEIKGMREGLFFPLTGGFAGGAVGGALLSFLTGRLLILLHERRQDALEQSVGEESFFVGEETLASFFEHSLCIHSLSGTGRKVNVPYSELRLYSVCTRRAPKEKGEWSILFEIPSHYFKRGGERAKAEPAVLVQTDLKERLMRAVEAHGLEVSGELPQKRGGTFKQIEKFVLPDRQKRKRALILSGVGLALMGAGIGVLFVQVTVGSVLLVAGGVVLGKSIAGYISAKGVLALYEEGIFWKDGAERIFLKWEEIGHITRDEKGGAPILRAECAYGGYDFPDLAGVYAEISERFPEKCGEKA